MSSPADEGVASRRFRRRLGGGLLLGAVAGALAGAVVGVIVGFVWSSPKVAAFWMAVVGLGIFGLAVGTLLGGYGSLESPDPGKEPSDTQNPIEDRPEPIREEHDRSRSSPQSP